MQPLEHVTVDTLNLYLYIHFNMCAFTYVEDWDPCPFIIK